jgi:gamma-glutamyltranspeptidase/glutathione hydrolase
MESGFDFEEIRKLMNKGHKVGFGGYGGYQAIMYDAIKVYFVHLNRVKTDKRQDTKNRCISREIF